MKPTVALKRPSSRLRKAYGVHYTPPRLADYLAKNIVGPLIDGVKEPRQLTVLDPACGDGELLNAFCNVFPGDWKKQLILAGRDRDAQASTTASTLCWENVANVFCASMAPATRSRAS